MIQKIQTKKEIYKFYSMVNRIYPKNSFYVLPFWKSFYEEMIFYLSKGNIAYIVSKNKAIEGRILLCFDKNKNKCYFSMLEFTTKEVLEELIEKAKEECRKREIFLLEGTYCPYDPDGRRGILVNQFDKKPCLFLSYNPEYYPAMLEEIGFHKYRDTLSMSLEINEYVIQKSERLKKFLEKKLNVEVSFLSKNSKSLKRDFQAIRDIFLEATTEINYNQEIDLDMISKTYRSLRLLLDRNLVLIARNKETQKPVGFIFVMRDYNDLFRDMKGRVRPFTLLYKKNQVHKAKGVLQYVSPEYQKIGLLGYLFSLCAVEFSKMGIQEFESSTIMEENKDSFSIFEHFNGYQDKIYRIYQMEVESK